MSLTYLAKYSVISVHDLLSLPQFLCLIWVPVLLFMGSLGWEVSLNNTGEKNETKHP